VSFLNRSRFGITQMTTYESRNIFGPLPMNWRISSAKGHLPISPNPATTSLVFFIICKHKKCFKNA